MRFLLPVLRFPSAFGLERRHTSAGSMPGRFAAWPTRRLPGSAGREARRSARCERIPGLATPAFPMAQNTIDDAGICNEGEDAHTPPAEAKEGIRFENFLNQPSPRAAGFAGEIRIILFGMFPCRAGRALALCGRYGNTGPVGVGAIEPLTMAPRIRDMSRNSVNPLERIQRDGGGARPGIGGCFHYQIAVIALPERLHGHGGPRDIASLRFERGQGGAIDRGSGKDRESGMNPGQEIVHEGFREALGPVQTLEQQAAEYLHDRRRIDRREGQELAIGSENAVGNQGVGVRIPVAAIGAEGLQRDHAAGADIGAVKQGLKGLQDGRIGRLRQQAQQLAVALEQAAQDAWERKRPVAVRY